VVNPVHLRTLLEVTRLGSFAAAATRLGYTASAVSQQMSALERDTGVRLFQRSARSVVPTDAAMVMARHAAKVLTDIEALMAAASKTQDTTTQELRLGIFPSLATYVLPRILRSPAWKSLGIDLKVSVAEPAQTIQGLRTGGDTDVALVYQVGQSGLAWPHTINRQWIGDDNFRVVLPAGWGFRTEAKVAADHLSDMPWIMHHPGTSDATVIERLFAGCNLHPRVVAYSDDFHASLEMATGRRAWWCWTSRRSGWPATCSRCSSMTRRRPGCSCSWTCWRKRWAAWGSQLNDPRSWNALLFGSMLKI
jgi:DNA-binding transcriptional LysR family regulator